MAVDISLEIETVMGEYKAGSKSKSVDSIQVADFTFNGGSLMLHGQRTGRNSYSDVTFYKFIDKSSPNLISYLDRNTDIKTAKIIVRKSGGKQEIFYTIELFDALISSFNCLGRGSEFKGRFAESEKNSDSQIHESFTINYARMTVTYAQQKPDGTVGGDLSVTISARRES